MPSIYSNLTQYASTYATINKRAAIICIVSIAFVRTHSQGTLQWTVTFDASPPVERGTDIGISYYYEAGMAFRPIGTGQFGRTGGGINGFPENSTSFTHAAFGDSLAVTSFNGQPFGVVSVDLAEYSTLFQTPLVMLIIGYKADGSTVNAQFITDGIIDGTSPLADFQTFYFDAQFADVTRIEFPNFGWSMDNLVFSQVPEPGTIALLIAGGVLLAARRWRKS